MSREFRFVEGTGAGAGGSRSAVSSGVPNEKAETFPHRSGYQTLNPFPSVWVALQSSEELHGSLP